MLEGVAAKEVAVVEVAVVEAAVIVWKRKQLKEVTRFGVHKSSLKKSGEALKLAFVTQKV